MGMDVYGKSPTAEEGKYFRRNAWGWRPLATLACALCPKETAGCQYWQSNDDGTGVRRDAVGIEMGQTKRIVPADAVWRGGKHPRAGQVGWCNGCDGRGFDRPTPTFYSVDEDDVREFVIFLRASGGFEIN